MLLQTLYKRLIGSHVTYTLYHCYKSTNNEFTVYFPIFDEESKYFPPWHKVPSYAIGNMTSLNVTSFLPPPQCFFWQRHCYFLLQIL